MTQEAWFGLAGRGLLGEDGMPSLLHMAVLVPTFADEIRVLSPPWARQRAAFAALRPSAVARGYEPA